MVATALGTPAFGLGAVSLGAASASATTARDTAVAADALTAATSAREQAERTHARLVAQLGDLDRELQSQFADAAELAAELEAARNQMRRSAISAFVAGPDDLSIDLLAGTDLAEASGRRTFAANRSLDWADAVERFRALQEGNDPRLVALTDRREALASRVADAVDAVTQAAAVEADAERAAAAAQQAAARQAAAARAVPVAPTAPAPSAPAAAPAPVASAPAAPSPRAVVPQTELSAPLPDLPPDLPPDSAWAEVRRCESGGNYQAVSGSGRYRGAYQFDQQTWEAMGGRGDPAGALPIEQDARAKWLYAQRGARAWPQCGRALVSAD